jgi:hypothetical protein
MGTLSKETGAVAGISQRQERYKRSAPAFLIILAALVLLLGFSMILSVCTGIASGFPVTVCITHPASARPIPHRTARTILGTRNCATTTEAPSVCGCNMLRTAAEKGILA